MPEQKVSDFSFADLEAAYLSCIEGKYEPPVVVYRGDIYARNPDGSVTVTPLSEED